MKQALRIEDDEPLIEGDPAESWAWTEGEEGALASLDASDRKPTATENSPIHNSDFEAEALLAALADEARRASKARLRHALSVLTKPAGGADQIDDSREMREAELHFKHGLSKTLWAADRRAANAKYGPRTQEAKNALRRYSRKRAAAKKKEVTQV